MDNVFLALLSTEQKLKLENIGVSFYDLNVAGEDGVVIEARDLPQVLELLGAYVASEAASAYEGIKRVALAINANVPTQVGNHAVTADWQRDADNGIVLATTQILMPVLGNDVELHYRKVNIDPIEDGKFHVHIFSSPVKYGTYRAGVRPPETVWGIPVEYREYTWPASGLGVAITDDISGYAVAELVGKHNLYIHHDLFRFGTINEEKIFRQVLLRTVPLLDLPQEKRMEHSRQLFIEECSKSAVRILANRVVATRDSVKQLKKDLAARTRTAQTDEQKLLRGEGLSMETFGDEYEGLLKVPKVKDVRVEGSAVVVYTDVLYCKDDRTGRIHEIGAFKIDLPFGGTSPRWQNLTRKVAAMRGHQHAPHIWEDGSACLGNTQDLFPKLLQERQFAIAAGLAIEFVESANTSDAAGKYISSWPVARY